MGTMNVSLPDSLKKFVDEQVQRRGYGTSSEYIRELIRRDHDRTKLRDLLLEGASSAPAKEFDQSYFDVLRRGVKKRARK
jgi:antitoxin ParD1/3/4